MQCEIVRNLNFGGDSCRQLVRASAVMFFWRKVNTGRLNTNGKQECEHMVTLLKVPDRVVRDLVIGRTAGGGTLETLRIEVNTCES